MSPSLPCSFDDPAPCGSIKTALPDKDYSMTAAPAAPPTPGPAPQPQHLAFLQKWNESIQPRLTQLLALLGGQEVAKSLALAQIFTYLPVLTENKQLLKAEAVCLLGNSALQNFHQQCCHDGVPLTHLGPMGKVWESGVVQVVQNAINLSADVHPVNRLPGALAGEVGEVVYLPVYDAMPGTTTTGVVAVVELMMNSRSTDVMVVANMISTAAGTMEALGLALSNPEQQAANLAQQQQGKPEFGRKSAPPAVGMRPDSSYQNNNADWASARSFGSGGGLSRTPSVRMLGTLHNGI